MKFNEKQKRIKTSLIQFIDTQGVRNLIYIIDMSYYKDLLSL